MKIINLYATKKVRVFLSYIRYNDNQLTISIAEATTACGYRTQSGFCKMVKLWEKSGILVVQRYKNASSTYSCNLRPELLAQYKIIKR